ncbi:MAG: site-2 protease family protein [Bacillota bacterium]
MFNIPTPFEIALLLPAIIIGLTFHELAHGYVAYRLGDSTAARQGRLTVNPIAHIDPIGFIALFLVGFGWAKPVPVNPFNMRGDPQRNMLLVSLAGPAANMVLAFVFAVLLGLGLANLFPHGHEIVVQIIYINIVLAVFNLLPIPPLDGSKILAGLLPPSQANVIYALEQYGFIILLILLFTGVISKILSVIILPVFGLLMDLATGISVGF